MPCVACTYMPNASWRRRGGKAQGRGITHPWSGSKAGAERTSAAKVCTSAARKTAGNPCAAPGQSPQRGLVSLSVRVSAQELSGWALRAGKARCGGKRRMPQQSQRGRRPLPKSRNADPSEFCFASILPSPGRCPKMILGRVRTVLGCGNPDSAMARFARAKYPYAFRVGEPVTYVQAPKLKVTGVEHYRLSNSPTSGYRALFAGAHRRCFRPSQSGGVCRIRLPTPALSFAFLRA